MKLYSRKDFLNEYKNFNSLFGNEMPDYATLYSEWFKHISNLYPSFFDYLIHEFPEDKELYAELHKEYRPVSSDILPIPFLEDKWKKLNESLNDLFGNVDLDLEKEKEIFRHAKKTDGGYFTWLLRKYPQYSDVINDIQSKWSIDGELNFEEFLKKENENLNESNFDDLFGNEIPTQNEIENLYATWLKGNFNSKDPKSKNFFIYLESIYPEDSKLIEEIKKNYEKSLIKIIGTTPNTDNIYEFIYKQWKVLKDYF